MVNSSCPVCYEILNDPVILSCSHSTCADCVTKLAEAPEIAGTIKCPKCRQLTNIPADGVTGLPKNDDLKNVVDKLKQAAIDKESARCGHCLDRQATILCVECSSVGCSDYCEECFAKVHIGLLGNHNTAAVGSVEVRRCPEHPTKVLEYVCTEDSCGLALICVDDVLVGGHWGHVCKPVAMIVAEKRLKIAALTAQVNEVKDVAKKSVANIVASTENFDEAYKQACATLHEQHRELHAQLETMEAMQRHELQTMKSNGDGLLADQHTQQMFELDRLNRNLAAASASRSLNNFRLLDIHAALITDLEADTQKSREPAQPFIDQKVQFMYNVPSIVVSQNSTDTSPANVQDTTPVAAAKTVIE